MTRIQEAREALDRASQIVLRISIPSKEDHRALADAVRSVFYATIRLVRLIRQNPDLSRVAGEAQADYEREHAVWAKSARVALLRLKELERKAEGTFPHLRPSTPPDRSSETWSNSLAHFDEIMGRLLEAPQAEHLSKDDTDTLLEILRKQLTELDPRGADQTIDELKNAREECRQELRHAQRAQLLLERSHPGALWKWLVAVNHAATPAPGTKASMMADSRSWRGELGPILKLIHEPDPSEWPKDLSSPDSLDAFKSFDWRNIWSFAELLGTRLANIVADFHARLGQRASIGSILQRYARRCTCLRREDLSRMLDTPEVNGKRERALAQDAAVFLFDQGFDVLTEQPQGNHRLDIKGEGLLVEAKIYDEKRSGLDAIVDGLDQIHSYANRLADGGDQVESVLLVFRLGGPRATPIPEYKIGNVLVTIAHVDLGGSDQSGRNSGPPEQPVITEDLITARLHRKRASGSTEIS